MVVLSVRESLALKGGQHFVNELVGSLHCLLNVR